jgi:ribokinase
VLTVFGSINLDVAIAVPHLPEAGETVLGGGLQISPGGKGANQAHAARLFGAPVQLVGAVGMDPLASSALERLVASGVELRHVHSVSGYRTGTAAICVLPDGDNAIAVGTGANDAVKADWVPDSALRGHVVLQLEVPVDQAMNIAQRCRVAGGCTILNAAPAVRLDRIDWNSIDWLVVNSIEIAQVARTLGLDCVTPEAAARQLGASRQVNVVVTLGSKGAFMALVDGATCTANALNADAVDTTGAGDTFVGVFAAALCEGGRPAEALRFASAAAGLCCTRSGAQAAQPTRAEIDHAVRSIKLKQETA